jgi:hypothetical protein
MSPPRRPKIPAPARTKRPKAYAPALPARPPTSPLRTTVPRPAPQRKAVHEQVLEEGASSLLDLIDNLLNKGVMLDGEVMLGVAKVDLVYLRLTAVLCAADRVMGRTRS